MMLSASGVTIGFSSLVSRNTPKRSKTVKKPTAAKKPTTRRRMPSDVSGHRAMTQQVVGEHTCHHGLTDRHGTYPHARVVPAMGRNLDLVAVDIDGAQRIEDRARRLHREPGDDVLPRRYPAEDAAGIVRQEDNLAFVDPHLVGVVFAFEGGRPKAAADLDPLDRIDRHQCAGKIAVELIVDRLSEPRRNAARDDFDDGTGRGAGFAHAIEIVGPA